MRVVFRVRDERLQRDIAVKILPSGALADDAARRRFRGEALALSAPKHPNIATVHDFDGKEGIDFLVTDYITGQALDTRIAAGPVPEKRRLPAMPQTEITNVHSWCVMGQLGNEQT